MNKPSKSELIGMTIAEIQRRAADHGISLPKSRKKADQIQLFLDLLESKKAEPETASPSTVVTLSCGHPYEVSHLDVLPKNVKAYIAAAKKSAVCQRCPAPVAIPVAEPVAVAEPEGEVSEEERTPEPETPAEAAANPAHSEEGRRLLKMTRRALMPMAQKAGATRPSSMTKGSLIAFLLEEGSSAPTPTKAEKSSATPKTQAPKAKEPKPVKKAARRDGREKSVEAHSDATKRLMKAKGTEAKAAIAAELMEATGWTVKTPTSPLIVEATYGDAMIAIEYPEDGAEVIPGYPGSPLVRIWRSEGHKGARLKNVSAAVKAANALMEALAAKTSEEKGGNSSVNHTANPKLAQAV